MRSSWNPAAIMLVALMAIGSVVMWLGVPLGLIYVASKLADTPNPSLGPYLLVLIGLPVGMALVGKGLGALNRAHVRLTGAEVDDYRPGWTRSMRTRLTALLAASRSIRVIRIVPTYRI